MPNARFSPVFTGLSGLRQSKKGSKTHKNMSFGPHGLNTHTHKMNFRPSPYIQSSIDAGFMQWPHHCNDSIKVIPFCDQDLKNKHVNYHLDAFQNPHLRQQHSTRHCQKLRNATQFISQRITFETQNTKHTTEHRSNIANKQHNTIVIAILDTTASIIRMSTRLHIIQSNEQHCAWWSTWCQF